MGAGHICVQSHQNDAHVGPYFIFIYSFYLCPLSREPPAPPLWTNIGNHDRSKNCGKGVKIEVSARNVKLSKKRVFFRIGLREIEKRVLSHFTISNFRASPWQCLQEPVLHPHYQLLWAVIWCHYCILASIVCVIWTYIYVCIPCLARGVGSNQAAINRSTSKIDNFNNEILK